MTKTGLQMRGTIKFCSCGTRTWERIYHTCFVLAIMFRMLQWVEWCSYKFKVIPHIRPFFPAVRFSATAVLFLQCDYRMQCDSYLDLGSEVFWGVWGAGGGNFVCSMLLGYVHPAYKCFKIVERKKPKLEHLHFWCQYWYIYVKFHQFSLVFLFLLSTH